MAVKLWPISEGFEQFCQLSGRDSNTPPEQHVAAILEKQACRDTIKEWCEKDGKDEEWERLGPKFHGFQVELAMLMNAKSRQQQQHQGGAAAAAQTPEAAESAASAKRKNRSDEAKRNFGKRHIVVERDFKMNEEVHQRFIRFISDLSLRAVTNPAQPSGWPRTWSTPLWTTKRPSCPGPN